MATGDWEGGPDSGIGSGAGAGSEGGVVQLLLTGGESWGEGDLERRLSALDGGCCVKCAFVGEPVHDEGLIACGENGERARGVDGFVVEMEICAV